MLQPGRLRSNLNPVATAPGTDLTPLIIANRNCKCHSGSMSRLSIFDPDVTSVSLHNPFGDCQSHTDSTSAIFGRAVTSCAIKALKDALTQVQWNAGPLIFNCYF